MSDLTPQQITVKEYKEVYGNFDKERLIQILIEDKLYIRKLHKQLYEKAKANGADKSTEPALHKHIVSNNEVACCGNCKYFKGETYHDRMYCRDCRQKDRFLQTDC